jgi:hypothetical protein
LPRRGEILDHGTPHCREISAPERLPRLEVDRRELRVVVEHPLEVRHVPGAIRRVTMEGARQMITRVAAHHLLEREHNVGLRALITGALHEAKLGEEQRRRGELEYPMDRKTSLPSCLARAVAASLHGYQSTGLCACCSR